MSTKTRGGIDAALALLLLAFAVLYLAAHPRYLSVPDEAHALHEATRVLDGERLYRDIFELITPGWIYLMALLFHVFGTTLNTARMTAAVIDGSIAVVTFLACRQLGVRRALAWACGFAYLVVCQPLYPVATQHWLATLLCVVLLALCIRGVHGQSWALAAGVVIGLLIAMHQQRGISMGVGVAAFLVVDALVRRRYGDPLARTSVVRSLGVLGIGIALVVAPLLIGMVASAGIEPVWRALVIQPLVNYHSAVSCRWGFAMWGMGEAPYAFPRLLTYLPLVLAFSVPSLLFLWVRRRDLLRARLLALLTLMCGFSMISIAYFPDIIHIAFIAPLFFVAVADGTETVLRLLPIGLGRAGGTVIAAAVVLTGGLQLQGNLARVRAKYPVTYASDFGEVALTGPRQVRVLEQLKEILLTEPSRTLYCHPIARYTYLLVNARNPTRFDLVIPPVYTGPDHVKEIIDTLDNKQVPYILMDTRRQNPNDEIGTYIRQHYERRPSPRPLSRSLWYRKSETDGAIPPPGPPVPTGGPQGGLRN